MTKNKRTHKGIREIFAEEEISLIDLARLFTDRKKHMVIAVAVFFVMGVLVAVTSPVEYQAEAQVLSEDGGGGQGASSGGLSGLADLAGVNLPTSGSGSNSGLSPDMYPTIAASEPFLLDLMQEKFYFQEKGMEMSLYEYFSQERPGHIFSKMFDFFKGIPSRFFTLFEKKKEWTIPEMPADSLAGISESTGYKKHRIVNVTNEQKYVIGQLMPRISIKAQGRIVSVKVNMPEPYISAQLNNLVLDKVIQYVISYKTEKQRENLEFIQERTNEAKENFKQAQLRLAAFRDANQGIVTQTAKTKEEQLQAEFNLAFNIYNGLAQQLEQTKIQLKKDTPLFTEFEPVTVPLSKAEPSIPRILAMYLALGFLFGGMAIFVSIVRAYFREPKVDVADTPISAIDNPAMVESKK